MNRVQSNSEANKLVLDFWSDLVVKPNHSHAVLGNGAIAGFF